MLVALVGCSMGRERPSNLILVSVDTLRADHLSCYGSALVSTPAIDRVAREGIVFENATTVAPTTLPAHASLLTGVTPLQHWVHDNVGFRLRDDIPTLASTLKDAGFRTGGFVGSFVLDRRFGLGRGFDVYSEEIPETESGLRERRGEEVLDEALSWIGAGDEPFFAFVHFFDPHRPYDPPAPFHPGTEDPQARYRGEVVYVDSLVGQLLAFLDSNGLSDSTVVAVTADHGESLGEHGEDTHGLFLYQSTLHVPLLLRGPSIPEGKRVRELVRIVDVVPTVLEALSVEAPSGLEGVSFLSASGEARIQDVEAYAETFVPRLHFGWSELTSLRRGNWKFVLAPRAELYDLDSDPEETRNLVESEASVVQEMEDELGRLKGAEDVRAGPVDERTLGSLRALGYLAGEGAASSRVAAAELADPKDRVDVYREILEVSVVREPSPELVERLEAVLKLDPRNPRALQLGGSLLLDLGRPKEAFEWFARMGDESFEGVFGQGRALLELGDHGNAKDRFERARKIDPSAASVSSRLASIAKAEGDLEGYERSLREAIELEPNASRYRALADFLLSSGREAELVSLTREWIGPDAAAASAYARGQLLVSQENFEGALVELDRALGLSPDDDEIELALANTLSRLGRFEEALTRYRSILARTPCYSGALLNAGAGYERLGRVEEAIRSYETAIRCDSSYASAYRNLGAALARKGELRRALDALRKARELMPDDREVAAAVLELESLLR
ncbi:MAG TPA: sulfatase-like hydrolase/transferase [Vicinamibacteria bacterium]|nr:sulfatase-like hydrolase/transferase [Vicinamibacteria bacterium]